MIFERTIQEHSEKAIFNEIGAYAIERGYEVILFKSKIPKLKDLKNNDVEIDFEDAIELVDMHYIHILKDEVLKVSIYYDEYNAASFVPSSSYYEIYDMIDIERFNDNEDGKIALFEEAKKLLK